MRCRPQRRSGLLRSSRSSINSAWSCALRTCSTKRSSPATPTASSTSALRAHSGAGFASVSDYVRCGQRGRDGGFLRAGCLIAARHSSLSTIRRLYTMASLILCSNNLPLRAQDWMPAARISISGIASSEPGETVQARSICKGDAPFASPIEQDSPVFPTLC